MITKTLLLKRTNKSVVAVQYDDLFHRNLTTMERDAIYLSKKQLVFKGSPNLKKPFDQVLFALPHNLKGFNVFISGYWVYYKGSYKDSLHFINALGLRTFIEINKFGVQTTKSFKNEA